MSTDREVDMVTERDARLRERAAFESCNEWYRIDPPWARPDQTAAAEARRRYPIPPAPEREPSIGLYEKFRVTRTDGTDRAGQKHDGCQYFVLDLDHDPHALPAIRAYEESCQHEYPALARDLQTTRLAKGLALKEEG